MITSYRDLKYDVLNLGRQEAWMGLSTLEAIMDSTENTEFVSANLIKVKSGKPVAKPYVIKDYGNMRVAVLGLLNEADFPKASSLLDSNELRVDPYFEVAKKYITMLRKKADAVVLLCELPTAAIDSLVNAMPNAIDLVISTGALRSGETATQTGRTHIVGPGSSGYSGHYAVLEFNPAWKDSVGFANMTDNLTDTYEEQGEWTAKLAAFNSAPASPASPPTMTAPAIGNAPTSVTPSVTPSGGQVKSVQTGTQSAAPQAQPTPPGGSTQPGHEGHTHG